MLVSSMIVYDLDVLGPFGALRLLAWLSRTWDRMLVFGDDVRSPADAGQGEASPHGNHKTKCEREGVR